MFKSPEQIIRKGRRFFVCDCGCKFDLATRDRYSPSGEDCPKCGEWCFPERSEEDDSVKVDKWGNLI